MATNKPSSKALIEQETIARVSKIEALFKEIYRRGPWPNKSQCYPIAVALQNAQKAPRPSAKNDDPNYVQSRATVKAMLRMIEKRAAAYEQSVKILRLPYYIKAIKDLNALSKALKESEDVLCPSNSRAGERRSARWHQPARYLAERVDEALRNAGHKDVKYDRDGRFIAMMRAVLALIGINRAEGAIAAALNTPQ